MREFMHQQRRIAGAAVRGRSVGNIVKEGAKNPGGLVERRRPAQDAAAFVVAVSLLLADHTGVIPESAPNAITQIGTGSRLDRAFKVGPVIYQIPGYGEDIHRLRAGAIDSFKRNRRSGCGFGSRARRQVLGTIRILCRAAHRKVAHAVRGATGLILGIYRSQPV